MERDLTTGSIGRNILKFSLPYFLSYFLQTLYGMADLFIIGQFNGVASNRCFYRKSGNAYDHGYDRWNCDGDYRYDR